MSLQKQSPSTERESFHASVRIKCERGREQSRLMMMIPPTTTIEPWRKWISNFYFPSDCSCSARHPRISRLLLSPPSHFSPVRFSTSARWISFLRETIPSNKLCCLCLCDKHSNADVSVTIQFDQVIMFNRVPRSGIFLRDPVLNLPQSFACPISHPPPSPPTRDRQWIKSERLRNAEWQGLDWLTLGMLDFKLRVTKHKRAGGISPPQWRTYQ